MLRKAFTLVELMIVIGILALLLTITLVAVNPTKQFAEANNTKRRSDTEALLNALNQYQVNHHGVLPAGIDTSVQTLSNTDLDICTFLVPQYLSALPVDPQINGGTPITDCAQAYNTNYTIQGSSSDGRVTIAAPGAQNGDSISVSR